MRSHPSIWQGCFGYWQPLFIREHLLPLGHAAWQGFLAQGRGIVACEVEVADAAAVDWTGERVPYTLCFIPQAQTLEYLQSLKLEAAFIARLQALVQTYKPEQDLLLSLRSNGPVDINLLHNLAIAPPDCYRQVCNRWDEFPS